MLPKLIEKTIFDTFWYFWFNLNAAFVRYIDNWWLKLSREDKYILCCKCPYVFSACWKVCVYLHVSKSLFASCATKCLVLEPLVGCKASCARKDKAENPGYSGLWERWVTEGKHAFQSDYIVMLKLDHLQSIWEVNLEIFLFFECNLLVVCFLLP